MFKSMTGDALQSSRTGPQSTMRIVVLTMWRNPAVCDATAATGIHHSGVEMS